MTHVNGKLPNACNTCKNRALLKQLYNKRIADGPITLVMKEKA